MSCVCISIVWPSTHFSATPGGLVRCRRCCCLRLSSVHSCITLDKRCTWSTALSEGEQKNGMQHANKTPHTANHPIPTTTRTEKVTVTPRPASHAPLLTLTFVFGSSLRFKLPGKISVFDRFRHKMSAMINMQDGTKMSKSLTTGEGTRA